MSIINLKSSLLEAVVLMSYSALLGLIALFTPSLLPLIIITSSVLLVFSYIKTFNPKNPLVIGICGGLSILFPIYQLLFNAKFMSSSTIIVPFVCYISFVFIITFGVQIVRNTRENSIETVGHGVVISLLVICNWGFLLANNFSNQLMIGIFELFITIVFICGFVMIIFESIYYLTKQKTTNIKMQYIIQVSTAVITGALFYLLIMNNFSFIPNILQVIFVIILPIITMLVTTLQFGQGKFYYAAILRGLFPIATSGIFLYLICVFSGVLTI